MTVNKLRKKDIDVFFSKVDVTNFDKSILYTIKKIIQNEVECSITQPSNDICISERNYKCFNNMLKHLFDNNLKDAWWEFTDIISFHDENDFLSINEVVFLDIALTLFLNKI